MQSNIKHGSKTVYAARFTDSESQVQTLRVLNQTGGSRSKEYDDVEISTKDLSGVDYGEKTETVSFEGLVTRDDPALAKIEELADAKQFVEILEIDIDSLKAKVGSYKVNSLEFEYPNDDSASYSFEATLFGDVTEETLTTVPAGDQLS